MSLDPPKLPTSRGLLPRLRRDFFTGLVIIAPTAISIWAAFWVVDKFDSLVIPWLPGAYNPDTYLPIKIPGFGLLLALILITLVGALGANLVGRTLIGWWDKALNSTPVVRSIYKGSKQIFETLFADQGSSFRDVCLVEWPRPGIWAMAFVSREVDGGQVGLEAGRKMFAVYVATTPNPTGGYLFFADQKDVKILDISVEEGLKLVISMGLIFPEQPLAAAAETRRAKRINQKPKA